MSITADQAISAIAAVNQSVQDAAKTHTEALTLSTDVNEKTAERNLTEFCTLTIEQASTAIDKELAANICIEQLASLTGLKGAPLGDHIKSCLEKMAEADKENDECSFGRQLSLDLDAEEENKIDVEGIDVRRKRFSESAMFQQFQG
jgi:hypothetical protein